MTVTIHPNARLRLPSVGPQLNRPVNALPVKGVATHCAESDDLAQDPAYELHMGLDIGTSSAKVVIRHENRYFAVPFYDDLQGIAAYLLPTKLYKETGEYCLNEAGRNPGKDWENIKLNLLQNPTGHAAQNRMVALMALIIRYARAWLFSEHGDQFKAGGIFWTYTVGVPSDPTAKDLIDLWEKLLAKAVIVAGTDADISDRLIDDTNAEHLDPDWSAVRAYAELVAEACALSQNHPLEGSKDFIVVDIGSGTLDMVMMTIGRAPGGYGQTYTIACPSVSPLGTFHCHRARLEALEALLKPVKTPKVQNDWLVRLRKAKLKTFLSALPAAFEDYYEDMDFSTKPTVDRAFALEVFFIFNRERNRLSRLPDLTREHITKAHILLCGGGARCRLYQQAFHGLGFERLWTNTIWLQHPDVRRMLPITRLRLKHAVDPADHDRLVVAYGLTSDALEKVTMAPLPKVVPEDRFERAFVSKEMV